MSPRSFSATKVCGNGTSPGRTANVDGLNSVNFVSAVPTGGLTRIVTRALQPPLAAHSVDAEPRSHHIVTERR